MVRRFKPGIGPMLMGLVLFVVTLVGVHTFVRSLIGREIADVSVVVLFFGGLIFLTWRS